MCSVRQVNVITAEAEHCFYKLVKILLAYAAHFNTPGVTQGVHPGLPHLTYYCMWIGLSKVHQT